MNEYTIVKDNNEIVFSLKWFNQKPKEIIYPKIEALIYENIVYLLLLIKEVQTTKDINDRIDKTSFIEENLIYLNKDVLLKINSAFLIDFDTLHSIGLKLANGYKEQTIDWYALKQEALKAITAMNLRTDLTSDQYESEHLDMDFLF